MVLSFNVSRGNLERDKSRQVFFVTFITTDISYSSFWKLVVDNGGANAGFCGENKNNFDGGGGGNGDGEENDGGGICGDCGD